MKTLGMITAILLLTASLAQAEPTKPKQPKPVVCLKWDVLRGKSRVAALCLDGSKPVILTRWAEVEIPLSVAADGVGGEIVRVIVGWR
jgi:hypothetical protein